MTKLFDNLVKVRKLFQTRDWNRRYLGMDKDGNFVSPYTKQAVSLSVFGALKKADIQSPRDKGKIIKEMLKYAPALKIYPSIQEKLKTGDYLEHLFSFQACPEVSKADIIFLLDTAISKRMP